MALLLHCRHYPHIVARRSGALRCKVKRRDRRPQLQPAADPQPWRCWRPAPRRSCRRAPWPEPTCWRAPTAAAATAAAAACAASKSCHPLPSTLRPCTSGWTASRSAGPSATLRATLQTAVRARRRLCAMGAAAVARLHCGLQPIPTSPTVPTLRRSAASRGCAPLLPAPGGAAQLLGRAQQRAEDVQLADAEREGAEAAWRCLGLLGGLCEAAAGALLNDLAAADS